VDTEFAVVGAKKGKRLVVYTNYRCPACRTVQQELDTLLTQDKKVRVIFHDFIPGFDPVATEAAYLTRCAAQWGAFSRMRQELLTREPPTFGQHWYQESELPQLMRRLRVKKKKEFLDCLGTDVYKAIEQETASALALGFEAPPMFIAEGIPVTGTPTAENLAQALAQGLKVQSQREQGIGNDDVPRNRRRRGQRSRIKWRVRRQETRVDTPAAQRRKSFVRQKSAVTARPPVSRKVTPSSRREKLFDLE
jgi:hypothetical protein